MDSPATATVDMFRGKTARTAAAQLSARWGEEVKGINHERNMDVVLIDDQDPAKLKKYQGKFRAIGPI